MKSPRLTLHRVRKDGRLPLSTRGLTVTLFQSYGVHGEFVRQQEFIHHPEILPPIVSPFTHFIIQPTTYDLQPVLPKPRKKKKP